MIIDLERFAAAERHYWTELAAQLDALERNPHLRLDLPQAERLHYLYQRAAADLARVATFSAEPELRRSLGSLVARAYAEIQGAAERPRAVRPFHWLLTTFPRAFRRRAQAFALAVAVTLAGSAFGAAAVALDDEAKEIILPFAQLQGDPRDRVADEEQDRGTHLANRKATFSSQLMANNIRVAVFALALGATAALGTTVVLFFNGVILGAVVLDYLRAGQGVFLAGWLLPHGSLEIPAILVAGQAGLILGGAIVGWGQRAPLRRRLREIRPDLVTLIGGAAVMLVWAGIVEAFFSQYHAPVLPYAVKIAFGAAECLALTCFLALGGRSADPTSP